MSIPWQSGTVIPMGPNSVLDYSLDLTQWLDGLVLEACTAVASDCVVQEPIVIGNVATFRVSNVVGHTATVILRVNASDGQTDEVVFRFTSRRH